MFILVVFLLCFGSCEENSQSDGSLLEPDKLPTSIYVVADGKLNHLQGPATSDEIKDFNLIKAVELENNNLFGHETPVFNKKDNDLYLAKGETVYKFGIDNQTFGLNLEWQFDTGDDIHSTVFAADRNPLQTFTESVYVGNDDGEFYCLDNEGKEVWKFTIGSGAEIRSSPTGRTFSSSSDGINPLIFFGADDGYLYAVSAIHGTELWKFYTGGVIRSSPLIYPYDKPIYAPVESPGSIVVGSNSGFIYSLDPWAGELQWQYEIGSQIQSSPAHFNNKVYVGGTDGKLYCFNADASNPGLQWTFQVGGGIFASPYGAWYKGEERIFFTSDDGYLHALDGQGDQVWSADIQFDRGIGRSSPVAAENGVVYINTPTRLFGLKIEDGSVLSEYVVEGSGSGSPTILTAITYGAEKPKTTYHSSILGNCN